MVPPAFPRHAVATGDFAPYRSNSPMIAFGRKADIASLPGYGCLRGWSSRLGEVKHENSDERIRRMRQDQVI
jgi:hypothetical protein